MGKYIKKPKKTIAERFWRRVKKTKSCWLWNGCHDNDGYAHFDGNYKFAKTAHRFSYFLHFGEIPENLLVCHTCDNPGCVNPNHFFLGTHQDNQRDKINKHRQAKGRMQGTYTKPESVKRGIDHHSVKLKESDVREIRKLKGVKTEKEIAKMFNVSEGNIYFILSFQTWKHLI